MFVGTRRSIIADTERPTSKQRPGKSPTGAIFPTHRPLTPVVRLTFCSSVKLASCREHESVWRYENVNSISPNESIGFGVGGGPCRCKIGNDLRIRADGRRVEWVCSRENWRIRCEGRCRVRAKWVLRDRESERTSLSGQIRSDTQREWSACWGRRRWWRRKAGGEDARSTRQSGGRGGCGSRACRTQGHRSDGRRSISSGMRKARKENEERGQTGGDHGDR